MLFSLKQLTVKKLNFNVLGEKLLNLYGLGLGATCNYYIFNVSKQNNRPDGKII
jgi:hypothetical protein